MAQLRGRHVEHARHLLAVITMAHARDRRVHPFFRLPEPTVPTQTTGRSADNHRRHSDNTRFDNDGPCGTGVINFARIRGFLFDSNYMRLFAEQRHAPPQIVGELRLVKCAYYRRCRLAKSGVVSFSYTKSPNASAERAIYSTQVSAPAPASSTTYRRKSRRRRRSSFARRSLTVTIASFLSGWL